MTLPAGTRLGPYEIVSLLGAGGMGEVYRALDTRLGRTVAIKTLNSAQSQRYQREARAIAVLNHPHICVLHDIGPDSAHSATAIAVVLRSPVPARRFIGDSGLRVSDHARDSRRVVGRPACEQPCAWLSEVSGAA